MKRGFLLILLAACIGLTAFGFTRWLGRSGTPPDTLEWMTQEFQLTPDQRAKIAALHTEYESVCERHCAAIEEARRSGDPAELQRLEHICVMSTDAHLNAVAACMSPDAARRFLSLVKPKLATFRHEAPIEFP